MLRRSYPEALVVANESTLFRAMESRNHAAHGDGSVEIDRLFDLVLRMAPDHPLIHNYITILERKIKQVNESAESPTEIDSEDDSTELDSTSSDTESELSEDEVPAPAVRSLYQPSYLKKQAGGPRNKPSPGI
jgi:hypothetical protein